ARPPGRRTPSLIAMIRPRQGLVAQLPFLSVQKALLPSALEVYLQRSEHNICDAREDGSPCDTASGLYYTWEDEESPALCPRHFYHLHFGRQAPCVLVTKDELVRNHTGA